MQPWHRWREPLAVTLLVALALMLVVRGLAFWLAVEAGSAGGLLGSIPGGDDLLLLAAAGAVLWCATPVAGPIPIPAEDPAREPGRDPRGGSRGAAGGGATASGADRPTLSLHAWPITVAGLAVVGLTVLGWLLLSLWNVVTLVSWPTPAAGFVLLVAEGVLRLAVPLASLVAVVLAVRRAASARAATAAVGRRALQTSASHSEGADDDAPAVSAAPERLPAAWQADEATGAVWLSADDAAQGRPGLSWSDPGSPSAELAGGWTPSPMVEPPSAAQPAQSTDERRTPDSFGARPGLPPAAEDDDLR